MAVCYRHINTNAGFLSSFIGHLKDAADILNDEIPNTRRIGVGQTTCA